MWSPAKYLAFGDHRARPFHDLLAGVGAEDPRRVVDLGCGPGTLTAVLARRWPSAVVEALDSAPEMVAAARERGLDARVGDVTTWRPAPDTDVVVANAVLHWVPGHEDLLRRWVGELPSGAWLAVQVPGNFDAPSHALTRALVASSWPSLVGVVPEAPVLDPVGYAGVLGAAEVDAWETTYLQRLEGPDAVLEWLSGTTLRPVRAALDDAGWAEFRGRLGPLLREAYPERADGTTWFPFRRVFAVARVR
ncbi:trans-aconitate 2-methyltransferase [Saccharothrix australiensis]|uniref:Trans-aconitate 2-methyltransferase n=1 Tax=Saccharothrix australiensis TaxID=2072 RepID=A0A495VUX4_9PSEU|nr:trans-aconitate 2-methyltransferase [Saccharothrix australiensis]RKT53196.1 trans-aconitate 2-methyltransferase [Saccharothrix australiensis]